MSEVFKFQTFEKLSLHPARGISYIQRDGQRKLLLMQLVILLLQRETGEGEGKRDRFFQSSARKSTTYKGKKYDILTWEFLKSQNKLLNFIPHWFLPCPAF